MFDVDLLPAVTLLLLIAGLVCAALYLRIRAGRASSKHLRAAKMGGIAAMALVPILTVRLFFWDITISPTGSMKPIIQPGAVMLLDKRAYNGGSMPDRGDVVVFDAPKGGHHQVSRYAKRLIALPGDTVSYTSDQRLIINGQPLARAETVNPQDDGMEWITETLGDTDYIIRQPADRYDLPVASVTIPDGHFFAIGDNRFNSHDSRAFGPVALELIVGKVGRKIGHIAALATDN